MPVGSSRTPEGTVIPEEYDITIVSTSDDEAAIRHAIEADDFPTDTDEASETDEAAAGAHAGDEDAGPEAGAGEEEPPTKVAQTPGAPPIVTGPYEPAVTGETAAQRDARLERNLARLQQQVSTLEEDNTRLRADATTRRTPEGDAGRTGERPAAPFPAFAFPTWEEYSGQHPEATEDQYRDARTDARYAWNDQKTQFETREATRRQAADTLLAESTRHITAAKRDLPDWERVVRQSAAPMTDTMHLTMLKQGELGPRLVYYLSQPEHLAEAQRIAALDPVDQVAALLDLRDTVRPTTPSAAAAPTNGATRPPAARPSGQAAEEAIVQPTSRRKASAAPAPLKPVPGEARSTRDLTDLDAPEDTDEFIARMDDSDRRRGRRR